MTGRRHYLFGPYSLDPARRLLTRDGQTLPLTARAFDVLLALIERRGETVEKDDLLHKVWPDAVVEEANLSQQVFTIRKLLGRPDLEPIIATVPRRGYRFVAEVIETSAPAVPVAPAPASVTPLRLAIPLDMAPLALGPSGVLAVSPDGSRVVYVGAVDGTTRLFHRALDEFQASEIPDTDGATNPFFSPDAAWIGFQADRRLRKVSLAGGPPVTLCEIAELRGATWSPSGRLVFAPGPATGLWQVDATGGTARPLTTVDYEAGERTHRWPHALPDGRGLLFTVGHAGAESFDDASIATAELDGSAHRLIVHHAADGRYVETGHLVWARGGVLYAASFELGPRLVNAVARPVQRGVAMAATGVAHFGVSSTGTLVHVAGEAQTLRRSLVVVDRQGAVTKSLVRGDALEEPRVASDGSGVIVSLRQRQSHLWLYDFARGTLARATFEGENFAGIWGPEAGWLTFSSSRHRGPSDLYTVRPDRPAPPELLVASEFDKVAGAWTPDGSGLLFTEYHPDSGADIWILDCHAGRARPFVRTPFNEYGPVCSPDGRHVAYTTDESGRSEVHVVSYPDATGKRQLSTDGGAEAVWSPDGAALFYRCADRLMQVDMSRGPHLAGIPTTLFEGKYVAGTVTLANYDVMPDGAQFVMTRADVLPPPSALLVTLHWVQELSG